MYCAQTLSLVLLTGRPELADAQGREMAARYPGIAGWVAAAAVADALLGRREPAQRRAWVMGSAASRTC